MSTTAPVTIKKYTNKITLNGDLTPREDGAIALQKFTTNGKMYVNAILKQVNGQGENQKSVTVEFTAWGELGERVLKLAPGTNITLEGYLRISSYTNKWNKVVKTKEVVANTIIVTTV